MRKLALSVFAFAAIALLGTRQYLSAQEQAQAPVSEQLKGYYTHIPWDGGTHADAAFQTAAGTTIPMFTYSITATKNNSTKTGTMVGRSPFVAPYTSTTINAVIVPLKINIGNKTFDPTAGNSCDNGVSALTRFKDSPVVQPVGNLTMNGVNLGTSQYVNGFRRAEFWKTINGQAAYQNPISFTTAAEVSINAGSHGIVSSTGCQMLGVISYDWFDNYLQSTLMPSLTSHGIIGPTKFVIFLMSNVVQSTNDPPMISSYCCILGYHGAKGNPVQTYSPMTWDTTGRFAGVTDASVASHELAEWFDDPLGTNPTPGWGVIGQVSGCQGNLEVGDPLSGTLQPSLWLNNKLYHMQEMAFFSWFFNANGVASLGTGGKFSSNGKFTGPAKPCPPGGTY